MVTGDYPRHEEQERTASGWRTRTTHALSFIGTVSLLSGGAEVIDSSSGTPPVVKIAMLAGGLAALGTASLLSQANQLAPQPDPIILEAEEGA